MTSVGNPTSAGYPAETSTKASKTSRVQIADGTASTDVSTPAMARKLTRIAAGHAGGVIKGDDSDDRSKVLTVLKQFDEQEVAAYTKLQESMDGDDPMREFCPSFLGVESLESESGLQEKYMRLGNLMLGFHQPFVMDVKLGVRSYLESECSSNKPRPDLFEKMVKMDPNQPTEEEMKNRSIVKHRWMAFRDSQSSSASLGFRVDGIAGPGINKLNTQVFARMRMRENVVQALLGYLPPPRCFAEGWSNEVLISEDHPSSSSSAPAPAKQVSSEDHKGRRPGQQVESVDIVRKKIHLAREILAQVQRICDGCQRSEFAMSTEFVGSSMLFVADENPPKVRVAVIDFAKSYPAPEGITLDHRAPWVLGNHEDGFLLALDELCSCWTEVVKILETELEQTLAHEFSRVGTCVEIPDKKNNDREIEKGSSRRWWCCV